MVSDAKDSLEQLKPEEVNALEGKDVLFSVRDLKLPFKAEGFLMLLAAQLPFPCDDGVRHPALEGRADRQARLHGHG